MFEKFTQQAIQVIMYSQEESRRLGHNFVGTEHILLGLIREEIGIGGKTLKSLGVPLNQTRIEIEKITGRGDGEVTIEIPFTANAKRLLESANKEAKYLGHKKTGAEHLLLGLLEGNDTVAVRTLRAMEIDFDQVRSTVLSQSQGNGTIISNYHPVAPSLYCTIFCSIVVLTMLIEFGMHMEGWSYLSKAVLLFALSVSSFLSGYFVKGAFNQRKDDSL